MVRRENWIAGRPGGVAMCRVPPFRWCVVIPVVIRRLPGSGWVTGRSQLKAAQGVWPGYLMGMGMGFPVGEPERGGSLAVTGHAG